jgi:hypothetical protein
MADATLARTSAAGLAALIRARKVSPVEVLEIVAPHFAGTAVMSADKLVQQAKPIGWPPLA